MKESQSSHLVADGKVDFRAVEGRFERASPLPHPQLSHDVVAHLRAIDVGKSGFSIIHVRRKPPKSSKEQTDGLSLVCPVGE